MARRREETVPVNTQKETERHWQVWIDSRRRIVSFHPVEGSWRMEFRSREQFLRCVSEYLDRTYRCQ